MDLFCEIHFEAAHRLPHVPPGHKCARLHGHSYQVVVHVTGAVDEYTGMVMDFADIRQAVEPLRKQLDHNYLNEIDGLDNPTSENLVRWIWHRLKPGLPELSKITIRETCTSGCRYNGEETP